METDGLKWVIGLLIIAIILLIGLSSDSSISATENKVNEEGQIRGSDGLVYEFITIDGMTCLARDGHHSNVLTCDWSKYRGDR